MDEEERLRQVNAELNERNHVLREELDARIAAEAARNGRRGGGKSGALAIVAVVALVIALGIIGMYQHWWHADATTANITAHDHQVASLEDQTRRANADLDGVRKDYAEEHAKVLNLEHDKSQLETQLAADSRKVADAESSLVTEKNLHIHDCQLKDQKIDELARDLRGKDDELAASKRELEQYKSSHSLSDEDAKVLKNEVDEARKHRPRTAQASGSRAWYMWDTFRGDPEQRTLQAMLDCVAAHDWDNAGKKFGEVLRIVSERRHYHGDPMWFDLWLPE